ncbi:hypothetical protein SNOG_14649 [Parastagonospora nodorum SN15]|uniref:DUF1446 domain-containing protein n=1 Tax=Phaeosphaeria nodorum (strain SN15 / ATCC MYA-4574 / FGSC 10173) TaxID=321614 RepID=Q0U0E4_PHANO|nr:hypothetical protein SNOG_14649 [Parastagonospora nodorum SN15]EAT77841.2 hypothetical protein SNOG_14649 [Parastagonospora nodorum SN15]
MPTALDGITQTLELANEKRIKIVLNGGALNPKGLAEKTLAMIEEKGLDLKVAYVSGDDLMGRVDFILENLRAGKYKHLDEDNAGVHLDDIATRFLETSSMPIVSANAYLGYRHQWKDDDFDQLAGALIAGHLIECSTYVTGANFAGAYKYNVESLKNLGLPIVEILNNGECVVTKHDALNGVVTADTVKCQFLYDVKADISNTRIVNEREPNRVHVSGVKGYPPPSTTKLAIFYEGGYQCEMFLNATGHATSWKWDYQEMQLRGKLEEWGVLDAFQELDFQRCGVPKENPDSQLASTTFLRIFAQAETSAPLEKFFHAFFYNGMQHFAATILQSELDEGVHILSSDKESQFYSVGSPQNTESLSPRDSYDPRNPIALGDFGETVSMPLGDIALARSGDKGGNVNCGFFVQTKEEWDWLRSLLTIDKIKKLMGKDWKDSYAVERIEFPEIYAVHYVIYGPLGRGVSSSKLLDSLGKGFAEFIRAVHVDVPKKFLKSNGVV